VVGQHLISITRSIAQIERKKIGPKPGAKAPDSGSTSD